MTKIHQNDCVPSQDSDQPGPPLRTQAFFMRTAKTLIRLADADPPSLIRVFVGRTCHFVGFVMRRLRFRMHQFWNDPTFSHSNETDKEGIL